MINGKMNYEELSPEEKQILTSRYGIQPKTGGGFSKYIISYVRELTDDEKIFFQEKSFLSPHFLTQSLYKLKGNIQPIRFNRVIREKVAQLPALRTNYFQLKDKMVAIIFENRVDNLPIVFRNMSAMSEEETDKALRTIMEADMRETFDLTRGHLIRFSIYKTGDDEYAALVTVAHLIFPEINFSEIFMESLGLSTVKSSVNSTASSFKLSDPSVKSYWSRMLENLPRLPVIPFVKNDVFGKKESKVYRKKISEDLSSELQRIAKSNRLLLMALIEAAWGILLAEYNGSSDVFFSALLPDKKGTLKVPAVRAMPVRIKISDDMTVEQVVMNTFQQLLISKPYSSLQIDELQEISGSSSRIFNHFLSFYDFMDEEKDYSAVKGSDSGTLVMRNSWDSGPSHIGMYFQYENDTIALTLIYNANSFVNFGETFLVKRFFRVILQMITDYNLSLTLFLPRLKDRIKSEEDKQDKKDDIDIYVRYAILGMDIFSKIDGNDAHMLAKKAKIKRLFEGDRISGEDLKENLVFLIKGRVARNIDAGDGWYRPLDIMKERSLLNIASILDKSKLPLSIEVLTDEAQVVFLTIESVENLIRKTPSVGKNLLKYAITEMEKYQYLWIQS